jgi:hypothetical protein
MNSFSGHGFRFSFPCRDSELDFYIYCADLTRAILIVQFRPLKLGVLDKLLVPGITMLECFEMQSLLA